MEEFYRTYNPACRYITLFCLSVENFPHNIQETRFQAETIENSALKPSEYDLQHFNCRTPIVMMVYCLIYIL